MNEATPSVHYRKFFSLSSIDSIGRARADRPYCPIDHYGLIGDCNGAALVAPDGSIDWCCLERFDAPAVFNRILDRHKGGYFEIRPESAATVTRRYLPGTCLLETIFSTDDGECQVLDFMPVGRTHASGSAEYTSLNVPGWLIRLVTGVRGTVRMRATYRPLCGFSEKAPRIRIEDRRITAARCPTLSSSIPFEMNGDMAVAAFEVSSGEKLHFVLGKHTSRDCDTLSEITNTLRGVTEAFWTEWTRFTSYHGSHREAVVRSALVLKLLTYSPSGAIVAAPTTSLPEHIGGVRNWDYRFCWIRDSCFALYALQKLGHIGEAEKFVDYLVQTVAGTLPKLLPLYGIDGETDLAESEIEHFEGYRGSIPVRVGNGAVEQRQHDVHGQLLDLLYFYVRLGGELDDEIRRIARELVNDVVNRWREPDAGLWEPRCPPRRYVHSAIMSWVALDRGIRLFGEEPAWVATRQEILDDVTENGVHRDGYLASVIGGDEIDAAVLVAPMVDFPLDRNVLERTIDEVIAQLGAGPLVYRYHGEDGLPGEEGTFLLCAFWLIDALLVVDRGDEARQRFDALLGYANDLGLFSEEMAEDQTFLGNFPQAFTHLGVMTTALVLDLYECGGAPAVRGTYADRALRDTRHRTLEPISGAPFRKRGDTKRSEASILSKSLLGPPGKSRRSPPR